ncbi:MAG: hypothetical protein JSS58_11570 [Proteobacteria bacterium]|nr:hypothetical protein [Pseudomonadota bacterium]
MGKSIASFFLVLFLNGHAHGVEQGAPYQYIGKIPVQCPITIKTVTATIYTGRFHITPKKAVQLAAETVGSGIKCNAVFLQDVYADRNSYYIIKSIDGPMKADVNAVIVNGTTGGVVIRRLK